MIKLAIQGCIVPAYYMHFRRIIADLSWVLSSTEWSSQQKIQSEKLCARVVGLMLPTPSVWHLCYLFSICRNVVTASIRNTLNIEEIFKVRFRAIILFYLFFSFYIWCIQTSLLHYLFVYTYGPKKFHVITKMSYVWIYISFWIL